MATLGLERLKNFTNMFKTFSMKMKMTNKNPLKFIDVFTNENIKLSVQPNLKVFLGQNVKILKFNFKIYRRFHK